MPVANIGTSPNSFTPSNSYPTHQYTHDEFEKAQTLYLRKIYTYNVLQTLIKILKLELRELKSRWYGVCLVRWNSQFLCE